MKCIRYKIYSKKLYNPKFLVFLDNFPLNLGIPSYFSSFKPIAYLELIKFTPIIFLKFKNYILTYHKYIILDGQWMDLLEVLMTVTILNMSKKIILRSVLNFIIYQRKKMKSSW